MQITNLTQPSAPAQPLEPRQLEFGRMFTPNFFLSEYKNGEWRNPRIQPVEPFALHPASLVFVEASDEALMRRFSETRRPHPLRRSETVERSIVEERQLLDSVRA